MHTASPSHSNIRRTLSAPETWIGVWMSAYVVLMLVKDEESPAALFLPLGIAAVASFFVTLRMAQRALPSLLARAGAGLLLLAIIASYLLNAERYAAIFIAGNVVSAFLLFFVATSISSRIDIDYRRVLVVNAVLTCMTLPIIVMQGTIIWGRLFPKGTTPNYIGMIALLCVIGALGARRWTVKAVLLAVSLATIVLVSSRASVLAAGIAIAIAGLAPLVRLPAGRRGVTLALALSGVGALLALSALPGSPFANVIGDAVEGLLKVHDPYRGLSSGGSGRTELWEAAIELWRSSPVFGVGFKGHQQFMPDNMLAHNAYLGLMADCGVVGLIGYALLCAAAVAGLFGRHADDQWARVILIVTYLTYGFVESRAFGFGNPYSIGFVLIAFDGGKVLAGRVASRGRPLPPARPFAQQVVRT